MASLLTRSTSLPSLRLALRVANPARIACASYATAAKGKKITVVGSGLMGAGMPNKFALFYCFCFIYVLL